MNFVHLHNHTEYSMLDGATRVEDMVKRAVNLGMPAVAITDHGYMCGVPRLSKATDAYNKSTPEYLQWQRDCELVRKGEPLQAPDSQKDAAYAQYEKDSAYLAAHKDLTGAKPEPLIKPIYGCEVYFTPDSTLERNGRPELYHMILLAKNEVGYQNLMQIVSEAASSAFYYKPRVTLESLKKRHEGIVATSGCVAGILCRHIMDNNKAEAQRWLKTFKDIFGDDYYVEIQEHGETWRNNWPEHKLAQALVELAHEQGVKVVATNDFHYLVRQDAGTQDLVSCIGTKKLLSDTQRMHMTQTAPNEGEYYMKTQEEMASLFSWCPEAIESTLEIAQKCNFELDWSQMYLPKFPGLKEGQTSEELFRVNCEAGLAKRYGANWKEAVVNGVSVRERFEYEYKVICDKGFADYFLIVQEYVQWAKEHGIGVGPGRGSAAGAIVAYALDITTLDPLENGLMFERFLSPERSEMPDIDMDFDDERRGEVIDHVREVYGTDRVSRIITYSTIKAKQAINDAARVLGVSIPAAQRLSKMVKGLNPALKYVLNYDPNHAEDYSQDMHAAYEEEPESKQVIDAALAIENLVRGESMHACAVLIAPTPVLDHVPTKFDTKGNVEITQYDGTTVAEMGMLKMDFLGLRTLTVISQALANIKANYNTEEALAQAPQQVRAIVKEGATSIDIDSEKIPLDDPASFNLMAQGHVSGVFQIESGGMAATIKGMKPTEYRQVVALIALYRPGPLQAKVDERGINMVDAYIRRMHGLDPVHAYDDRLASILDETYGTMVYQEQVMQIAMKMSGFSAGEADSRIRKPVAKKKIKLLTSVPFKWEDGMQETTYDHWMHGAQKNGYSEAVAKKIWDDVLQFASYAFNKSHSAAYAVLVMQTAWLKAYYPREYMAAVLTSYTGKTEKIMKYITAARKEGIEVMAPDINESGVAFTATHEGIRIGLSGIKGIGTAAAEEIIAERERGGAYKNLLDFMQRNDPANTNKRIVEALIQSGAFDSTGYPRRQLMHMVDKNNKNNFLDVVSKQQKERATGQTSLLDMLGDASEDAGSAFTLTIDPPQESDWDPFTKLAAEHEVLGFYISGHPLDPYACALERVRDVSIGELLGSEDDDVFAEDALGETTLEDSANLAALPEELVQRNRYEGRKLTLAGLIKDVSRKTTKRGDAMATFILEDTESEIEVVVFPKTYKKVSELLRRSETEEYVFCSVTGHLELDDRRDQFLASHLGPLDISDAQNKRNILEIKMPQSKMSQFTFERLNDAFGRYPGVDMVELFFTTHNGGSTRFEIPLTVDAKNPLLSVEIKNQLGSEANIQIL